MKKKSGHKLMKTGLPFMPIMVIAEYFGLCYLRGVPPSTLYIPTGQEWLAMVGIAIIPILIIWMDNANNIKKINELDGREQAKRPVPPADFMYKEPVGFCFGKHNGRYVCKRIDEPGSILVQGSSGSGKSSSIIQGFLLNPENKKNCRTLVLDLKHELADKCLAPEEIYTPRNTEGNSILLDPFDRLKGYGFDAFWELSEASTESEVHDVMEVVAQSLIPPQHADNQIWANASRQLFRGCLTYFYFFEGVRTLPEIIMKIKEDNIKNIVNKVLSNSSPGSIAYMDIINFKDMADETLTSVDLEMSSRIIQFAVAQDLMWCLGSNPRKCSPKDLLEKNIYLCIPENKLTEWAQLVLLIFNMSIHWMMGLPEKEMEKDRPYLVMILDETVALLAGIEAKMSMLSQCLRIGARSKGCTMLICVQSMSGLYEAMGKDSTRDMVNNLTYKYILDCTDTADSKEIIAWAGKYMKKHVTASGSGIQRKDSTSYSEEDILTEKDLVSLPREEEIVLISSRAGYLRLEKCYVFKDKFFKPLLESIKEKNKKKFMK